MTSNRSVRPMGLSAILVLLAGCSTWSAPAGPPPWVVESPSAGGARFGLGLELLSDSQESLDIDSSRTVTTLTDPATGRESRTVLDGDAGLLNRKFDLAWKLDGPAAQIPVGLGCFSFLGTRVHPTLTLDAASADVSLDFLDRPEPDLSTSLGGRSPLFGGSLSFSASLCPGCRWFAGAGYRFSTLSLKADRSPRFAEPGFEVLDDEVRLRRELHEISARLGYVSSGNRVAYHVGLRGRWNGMEIEDELRLASERVRQETTLSSRTDLESSVLQGVAGMDARLGGSLFGRAEVAVGSGDEAVQLKVVYLKPAGSGEKRIRFRSPRQWLSSTRRERLLRSLAVVLAPRIGRIVKEFREGWNRLEVVEGPGGEPAYRSAELDDLLRRTGADLDRALREQQDLDPLADWMRDRFAELRKELTGDASGAAVRGAPSRILPAAFRLAQSPGRVVDKDEADQGLSRLDVELATVRDGRYVTRFTFEVSGLEPGASLYLYPKYNRNHPAARTLAAGQVEWMVYGDYSFEVSSRSGEALHACEAANRTRMNPPCPLTLFGKPVLTLRCQADSCRSMERGERP